MPLGRKAAMRNRALAQRKRGRPGVGSKAAQRKSILASRGRPADVRPIGGGINASPKRVQRDFQKGSVMSPREKAVVAAREREARLNPTPAPRTGSKAATRNKVLRSRAGGGSRAARRNQRLGGGVGRKAAQKARILNRGKRSSLGGWDPSQVRQSLQGVAGQMSGAGLARGFGGFSTGGQVGSRSKVRGGGIAKRGLTYKVV